MICTYNAFLLPFEHSFGKVTYWSGVADVLDFLIDIIFLVDIILMFFTSYLHPRKGKEIKDPYRIAKNYL